MTAMTAASQKALYYLMCLPAMAFFFSTLKKSKVSHHGHREVDVKRAESLNSGDSFTDIMSYVRNNAAAWQLSLFFSL